MVDLTFRRVRDGFGGSGNFTGGFEDIFSSFFGGGGSRADRAICRGKADLQYVMDLTFEEASW